MTKVGLHSTSGRKGKKKGKGKKRDGKESTEGRE
jgi:hypothetical protein